MAIKKKQILKRLDSAKGDRGKVTLYLSKKLIKEFKQHCEDHSVSSVIEELMRDFIKSAKL